MNPTYWALGLSVTLVLAGFTFAYKFGKWQGEVDNDRNNFKEYMKEVRSDIKEILSRLPAKPISSSSPIRLTELGERISKKIDAKSWAKNTAQEMIEETEGMDSLKIQEESFNKAKNFEPNETLLQNMRDSAFQEGIDLEGVKDVLGVELRDQLLAIHGKTKESLDK